MGSFIKSWPFLVRWSFFVLLPLAVTASGVCAIRLLFPLPAAQAADDNAVILEDFDDVVTPVDLGVNDFAGNMGTLEEKYVVEKSLQCVEAACNLRLGWDFDEDAAVFTGLFFSLFGLTDTKATFGGPVETISFPEHRLDLDQVDGALMEPGGPRQFLELCLALTYEDINPLNLRVEPAIPVMP